MLASRPALMRCLVAAFIPAAEALDEAQLQRMLERADDTLADRPPGLRRQVALAVSVLGLLGALRFMRPLARVPPHRCRAFLRTLQDGPVLKLRLAVWGVRTLIYAGYYGDPQRHAELGYRPRPEGWAAMRGQDHDTN